MVCSSSSIAPPSSPSSPPLPELGVSRKELWKKTSILRRVVSFVEADLDQVIAASPFLQREDNLQSHHIALFHRSEIVLGSMLGKGGFSEVHEIIAFQLDPMITHRLSKNEQQLREQYAKNVLGPSGRGRYAIKFLQYKLLNSTKEFQCAVSDLAMEATCMSRLDHPHIVPIRGLPIDGLLSLQDGRHDGYFIICDRLKDTLDKRIIKWRRHDHRNGGAEGGGGGVSIEIKLKYALQLANALEYLHERRIIFRDLKPHNIGFTDDDQIQLFDFGLCRELPIGADGIHDVYEMSGVGTRRYMAVEVINDGHYNLKADVYSWAMVVWEMLSLTKPFDMYTMEEHRTAVCQAGERPRLDKEWPLSIQTLLRCTWNESVPKRLSMREALSLLSAFIRANEMLSDSCDSPKSSTAIHLDMIPSSSWKYQQPSKRTISPSLMGSPSASYDYTSLRTLETIENSVLDLDGLDLTMPSLEVELLELSVLLPPIRLVNRVDSA